MSPQPPLGRAAIGSDDVLKMHAGIERDRGEPQDGHEPVPVAWLVAVLALALWSGWYLGTYSADFGATALDGAAPAAVVAQAQAPPPVSPWVLGRRVYSSCTACHQAGGGGVAGQVPPLAASPWVLGSPETLARILLHGLGGPLEVLGATYDGAMPAWGRLDDERIAAVLTYIRGSFGNDAGPVEAPLVAAVRAASAGRRDPWTAAALQAAAGAAAGGPP